MRLSFVRRFVPTVAVLSITAASLAACGGSSSSSSNASTSSTAVVVRVDPALSAAVPAKFKGKTLTVAADASYPPNESIGTDGKTVVGMDADLAKAIANKLGLTASVQNVGFDAIIPGLAAGKYNVGMSSFTDTKEREQTVDFVTYLTAGTSFFVKADGGPSVNGLGDLCGLTVSVEKGTTQETDVQAQAKKCPADKKLTLLSFPDQSAANLALSSGRAQVSMADSPVAAYQVKQSGGKFKLSGAPYGTAPYGIALPKNSGLAKPVLNALKALIASGEYKKILTNWGVQDGAISAPVINGAQS
jgi:polar amino acid transport system substrate-binding protein